MKKTACLLAALLGTLCASRAQVEVEVVMDQAQFLSGEMLPVAVRIVNYSGQTLQFGSNDWLNYTVEARSGAIVEKLGEPRMAHNFTLDTSKSATQRSDLAPYFQLSHSGQYTVSATVKLADWDREITSAPKGFDIITGVKLWEQQFGVVASEPANHEPPEVRKYILQKATYLKHLMLYLRVTDASESQIFRVMAVGPMTSFSQPQTRLDKKNSLHLIYETAARTYSYTVVNSDGDLTLRRQYVYTDTAPRLRVDEKTGDILVVGGARNPGPSDLPPVAAPATVDTSTDTVTNSLPHPKP